MQVWQYGMVSAKAPVPTWLLAIGGFGIALGLATCKLSLCCLLYTPSTAMFLDQCQALICLPYANTTALRQHEPYNLSQQFSKSVTHLSGILCPKPW
jgi:hypothetical protein